MSKHIHIHVGTKDGEVSNRLSANSGAAKLKIKAAMEECEVLMKALPNDPDNRSKVSNAISKLRFALEHLK